MAAAYTLLPDSDAVMVHVPGAMKLAVAAETVQTWFVEEVNVTADPELAGYQVSVKEGDSVPLTVAVKIPSLEEFHQAERGPFQLTNGPMNSYWPVPTPDGKRLFIGGSADHGRLEFLRYDSKTGQFFPDLSGISGTELEFSKDGKWVAYLDGADGGSLWRAASDGSQRLRLTSPPPMCARHPHWSPNGQEIAFNGASKLDPSRIYLVSSDGGALKQVSNGENGKAGDWDASWSPDGASLAFSCDYTATRDPMVA